MKRDLPQDEPGNRSAAPVQSSRDERRIAIVDQRIDSRDLFVATREITISHGEDRYRLRLTAQNKLILTK
jgi:hemin uptake protein HemP